MPAFIVFVSGILISLLAQSYLAASQKWKTNMQLVKNGVKSFEGEKQIAAIKAGCDELFKKNLNMSLNGA